MTTSRVDELGLTLPHPRLFERAFVLLPLAEIVAGAVIAGRRAKDALAGIDVSGIERLPRSNLSLPGTQIALSSMASRAAFMAVSADG